MKWTLFFSVNTCIEWASCSCPDKSYEVIVRDCSCRSRNLIQGLLSNWIYFTQNLTLRCMSNVSCSYSTTVNLLSITSLWLYNIHVPGGVKLQKFTWISKFIISIRTADNKQFLVHLRKERAHASWTEHAQNIAW